MKTEDAIRARRAVKHYDANHSMTAEEINKLLSLAILSPTAFNIQN
jgi:nitroreductase